LLIAQEGNHIFNKNKKKNVIAHCSKEGNHIFNKSHCSKEGNHMLLIPPRNEYEHFTCTIILAFLHGPVKEIGATRNFPFGIYTVDAPVEEHAAFQAARKAYITNLIVKLR
jgi:hypothetical protein